MKSLTTIIAITLFNLFPLIAVQAQGTTKSPEKNAAAPAGAGKRTDVYHVHFTKAALGKAAQLGDWLKTPNPNEPMPDHFIVLRHKMATPGITRSSPIWAQKRLWKLLALLCLQTNAT